MLTLLMAEDELIEREALRYLIEQQYSSNISIVYEASTGKEMLEQALRLKPDMIMMDIQMPEMDGLSAAEMIRNLLPETEIIILTAYSHFDYAKRAILIGANNYLLKPISNQSLYEAIDRMVERIRERKITSEKQQSMNKRFDHWKYLMEKELIFEALYPSVAATTHLNDYLEWLQLDFQSYSLLIMGQDHTQEDIRLIRNIKNKLSYHVTTTIATMLGSNIVMVLFDKQLPEVIISRPFAKTLQEVKTIIQEKTGSESFIGKSQVYQSIEHMTQAYSEAMENADHNLRHHSQVSKTTVESYPYAKEEQLCVYILQEDYKGSLAILRELLEWLATERRNFIGNDVIQLCTQIHRSVQQHFGSFPNFPLEDIRSRLEQLSGIQEIALYMQGLLPGLIEAVSEQKKSSRDDLMNSVKAYLEEHFAEEISLEQISRRIGLSSFYFSKYFKKMAGINFKEYLIQIRMEKAMFLMKSFNKSVKEVTLEVGYNDPNYFSKAFKKYTGLSPTQFISQKDK
ncbi:response regulator [Paenibacillus puerhi]|uniref:response regulator n=1 Tax=Paenibacillus puerhi TaxID=2692622 RepID=UPI001358193B|nr:response regulator [Paenibacillus puerhi]